MRKLVLTVALALLVALGGVTGQAAQADKLDRQATHYRLQVKNDKKVIAYLMPHVTLQLLKGRSELIEPFRSKALSRYVRLLNADERRLAQVQRRIQVRNYWRAVYRLVPHYSDWLCIHHYEGSWTDSGAPYYGGLQMDIGFMNTYGSDMVRKYSGYANVWPPLAQMIVAERAYRSGRGFYPWPNTARFCGLI